MSSEYLQSASSVPEILVSHFKIYNVDINFPTLHDKEGKNVSYQTYDKEG